MASTPRALIGWRALTAAIVVAACMGLSHIPIAAPAWVRNALSLGRADALHDTPLVARFDIDEGGGFVLDRSHRPPVLKFDDSPEIWALTRSRGPRGDVLFKDDAGDILLRATKLGGITVFSSHHPGGSAATLAGKAAELHLAALGPVALYQRMIQASVRSRSVTRRLVGFDAPNADAKSAAIIADAANLAVQALTDVWSTQEGKAAAGRVARVVFIVGARPDAWMRRGALFIVVTPADGIAGHPSSARIAQAIEGY